ncbi:MAG TPA: hemolysin family protein, partial [Rhodothermales bacterium]
KSLALQHAEKTVLRVTPAMLTIQAALYPFVVVLNGLGNAVLRIVGINRQEATREHFYTAEELRYIIRESHEGGLLRSESARLLGDLFDFSDLTAGEVMVPRVRVRGIPLDASRDELTEILRASQHSRYPVYEEDLDHVRGVVHVRDLLQSLIAGRGISPDETRPVAYVPETTPLDIVLETMRQNETELIVVMDEHGGTAGIVTVEDLFEEIVGEIEEGVAVNQDIFRDHEGRLHVAGTVRVEEVGEHLGLELEHEEVDTVSGLVLAQLNRPPRVGDSIVYDRIRFEVTAVQGHGVRECVVSPAPDASDTSATTS